MEVLYHIRPYLWRYIPLHRPYIGLIYGRYLQFRFLKWPLKFAEDSHLRSMDLTPAPSPSPAHPPARGRAPRGEDEAPFEENGETLNLGWKKRQ